MKDFNIKPIFWKKIHCEKQSKPNGLMKTWRMSQELFRIRIGAQVNVVYKNVTKLWDFMHSQVQWYIQDYTRNKKTSQKFWTTLSSGSPKESVFDISYTFSRNLESSFCFSQTWRTYYFTDALFTSSLPKSKPVYKCRVSHFQKNEYSIATGWWDEKD